MAPQTLPALSRTALAQVARETPQVMILLAMGDRHTAMRVLARNLRADGLFTVRIADIYSVCSNLMGVETIYD